MELESGAASSTATSSPSARLGPVNRSSNADGRHRTKLKLNGAPRSLCQRRDAKTGSKSSQPAGRMVAQINEGEGSREGPRTSAKTAAATTAGACCRLAAQPDTEPQLKFAQTARGAPRPGEQWRWLMTQVVAGGGGHGDNLKRGIYFHRIDHNNSNSNSHNNVKLEEAEQRLSCDDELALEMRRTRRRRRGRRRMGGDGERGCMMARATRGPSACAASRPMLMPGVLTALIIISLQVLSLMLISTQANCQVIELGEGLTLSQNNNNNRHSASSEHNNNQQQQQHEWPLQHLERIKAESKVSAVLGENVVLNCAVQFKDGQEKPFVVNWLKYPHKLPIYIWYAGYPPHVAQGYESRVTRIGQASLNVSSVRESDKGLYECKIYYLDRRQEDKGNGTWIYLDVQAPPHFVQTPPSISYVQAGDSLHLTCQAQSTPAPALRWYKNKVPIDSDAGPYRLSSSTGPAPQLNAFNNNQQQQQAANNNNANSQAIDKQARQLEGQNAAQLDLFIDNVQAGQTTGDYVCRASNDEGTIEARSQVVLAVPAVITTWPRNQTRLEGERVELLCQAKALPANITYKWLFNNKPLQSLKWFDSRYTLKRDGTLVIHSLHRDDQGEFKCQATNGLSHRARLAVGSSENAGDQYVSMGGAGAGGNSNNQLSSSGVTTTTTTVPSSPQMTTATTAPIYAEAAAYLNVEFPARVTYSPPVQYLPMGLAGQIRCYVQSVPPVEFYTWTLNNQQFDPNADPNIERLQNGSLVIKQVNESYEGQYRCTPFNKHGSAGSSAAMEVRVQEPPQFVSRPDEFYKANLNGQIRIPCEGRGSPKPTVSWRRVTQVPRGHHQRNQSFTETSGGANEHQQQRLKRRQPKTKGVPATTTRHFNSQPHQQQQHLAYDEAADEPDETHHFYAATAPPAPANRQDQLATGLAGGDGSAPMLLDGQLSSSPDNNNNNNNNNLADESNNQQQRLQPAQAEQQEQQTVIVYAKLPSDRSEYKNSYLHLHNLRKEDHGRYECVVENEVATLVASTMLYIEETTPHAPTDVRVDAKAWSAQVTWTPGYDGGFEQSFVVWYRQVDRPKQNQLQHQQHSLALGSSDTSINGQQENGAIDVNWHSQSVQPSDATSQTIQNLSQDTTYEFYVRAKNIIGEGPNSRVVQATTKRAILGSVTPMSAMSGAETVAASTVAGIGELELNSSRRPTNYEPTSEEDSEPATVTSPASSIRPYLIIHPEYVSPSTATSDQSSNGSRPTAKTNQDGSYQATNQGASNESQATVVDPSAATSSSNKVIKIYFPSSTTNKQPSGNDSSSSSSPPNIVGKRTSIDQGEHSNNPNLPQVPADQSTAPQNVSMMKVAQGWVLSWAPPRRLPSPFGDEHAEAIHQASGSSAAMSQQQQADEQISITGGGSPSSSQLLLESVAKLNKDQRRSQLDDQQQQQPFAYSIELKEKNASGWQTLATSREQSLLLKDLRAGGDYRFRVIAHTASGLRGSPSDEFSYSIPDNKRKPGLTQAFSATVTSGLLFFIACIVIAVCGVNMCNKRRKKRAEKGRGAKA